MVDDRSTRYGPLGKLAFCGGEPAFPEGPPSWPLSDEPIRVALEQAWRDGDWGRYQGKHGERLASNLARFHGVPHVWLCCSGTFAVELALRALRIGEGDEVLLAGYDFSGNFRAIEDVGAVPVLVDVEPGGWRLSLDALESAVTARTRALLVSHLHGALADMAALRDFANQHHLALVEDACQAVGATIGGRPAGSWGDVGVLSFGGSKLLSAGRGGAILTHRAEVWQRAKIFCERGNDAFPLSELQAAVLLPQLESLPQRHVLRHQNTLRLLAHCAAISSLLRPHRGEPPDSTPAYYKLGFLWDPAATTGHSRQALITALQKEGVAIDEGFRGFAHRSPRRGRRVGTLPHSRLASTATVVLHHPILLSPPEVIERLGHVIRRVVDFLGAQMVVG